MMDCLGANTSINTPCKSLPSGWGGFVCMASGIHYRRDVTRVLFGLIIPTTAWSHVVIVIAVGLSQRTKKRTPRTHVSIIPPCICLLQDLPVPSILSSKLANLLLQMI